MGTVQNGSVFGSFIEVFQTDEHRQLTMILTNIEVQKSSIILCVKQKLNF